MRCFEVNLDELERLARDRTVERRPPMIWAISESGRSSK